jgi:adenylate kinase family enzyme
MVPKAIVIRGPAGAGKSTVALDVIQYFRNQSQNFAYIEQDYFNGTVCGRQANYRELVIQMMSQNVRACKSSGYNVLVEGILNTDYFSSVFDDIITCYGEDNVTFYYFDVSLNETKRRHMTRAKANDFSVDMLDEWYSAASHVNYDREVVLNETLSKEEAVKIIIRNYESNELNASL